VNPTPPARPSAASPLSKSVLPAQPPPGGLEQLLDMEMPVLVRLGRTKMMMRELLALEAGSTIEFRRVPDDPADILVNGRVVARGAVVSVQGNYGVRITEIVRQPEGMVVSSGPIAREVKE